MIIGALTAIGTGAVVWEILDILYHVHVAHKTTQAGYEGGSSVVNLIQQGLIKLRDYNNPAQAAERNAKTPYDFKAIGDETHQKSQNEAEVYLHKLKDRVANLLETRNSFFKINERLPLLLNALRIRDERQFSSHSQWFQTDFKDFKSQFNEFLLIQYPPRQSFYIADLYRESGIPADRVTQQYNNCLNEIKSHMESLKDGKQRILDTLKAYSDSLEQTEQDHRVNPLNQCVDAIPMELPGASTRSAHGAEPLPQAMGSGMNTLEPQPETSSAMRSENEGFADLHKAITEIAAVLQRTGITKEPIAPWKENPHWFPLLTEEEQSEFGQRMFLHAMDEKNYSADEKLLIATIFLRQHVPSSSINQLESDLLSHELAGILRGWQIKKCGELTDFLITLTQETALPEHDPDGLLEWLKTKKHDQSAIELLREILVSPCCFSQLSFKLAVPRLKKLLIKQDAYTLIERYRQNYWGAIREKNDQLIQLPTFSANILPRDCMEKDYQSKNANVVSSMMDQLAKKLMIDLTQLKEALKKNKAPYLEGIVTVLKNKKASADEAKKNQVHQQGVQRIKRSLSSVTSLSSSLSLYLYHASSNEEEKKWQVPTRDDLLYVIYKGVDPNGMCHWKSSPLQAGSNQVLSYLLQKQEDDSRTKACIYAFQDCQADAMPLFSSSSPLALEYHTPAPAPKNTLSIDVILKDPNKLSAAVTDSAALKEVSPKERKAVEISFKQLQNYYVYASTSITPGQAKQLPFMQQLKYVIKNLFRSTQEIKHERLESVRIFVNGLCVVLSEKDANDISKALKAFKNNYEDRCIGAKKIYRSVLYTTMLKLIDGPISSLISQFSEEEQAQFKIEEEKIRLEKKVEEMQVQVKELEKEKEDMAKQHKESVDQLRKALEDSEAKRLKDKEDSEAKRLKDKEDSRVSMRSLMKELLAAERESQSAGQSALTAGAEVQDAQVESESHQVGFFK